MQLEEYIHRVRELLHDQDGKVFTDAELEDLIVKSVESYCRDSKAFRGMFNISVDETGECKTPDNYLGFVAGWNMDGEQVHSISTKDLSCIIGNYDSIKGVGRYVTEDFSSSGYFKVVPNPYDVQSDYSWIVEWYKLMPLDNYGTAEGAEDFGIPVKLYQFTITAEASYVKLETIENIDDPPAVVYRTVSDAYDADGDFQDLDKAELFDRLYKKRIALRQQNNLTPQTVRRGGRYF